MRKLMVFPMMVLGLAGCASNNVAIQPTSLMEGQTVVRQDQQDAVFSRRKLDVELTPTQYRAGEPLLVKLRIFNGTDNPVVFDPQQDIVATLDGERLKTLKPEEVARPKSSTDVKVLGVGLLLSAVSNNSGGPAEDIFGGLVLDGARRHADQEFEKGLLKAGTILPKQWLTGYVPIQSYHSGMLVMNQPYREGDVSNYRVAESFSGKVDIVVRLGEESHGFAFTKIKASDSQPKVLASRN